MNFGGRIGILGGTLDPVHLGHLETARAARQALALDRVLLLPSRVPPHRSNGPDASPFHRFAMTAIAVSGVEGLEASDLELTTPGPSYTADTLLRLHDAGLRRDQIFFITGADAFAEIETWSRYPGVLDLSHFVVVSRPGHDAALLPNALPAIAPRMRAATADAVATADPTVFLLNARTPDVSSTDIRARLRAGRSVRGLVPDGVEQHIRQHHLYTQNVTSTDFRSTADHLHGKN
jgi:nicotinate-nucleotide adenylyltransferase